MSAGEQEYFATIVADYMAGRMLFPDAIKELSKYVPCKDAAKMLETAVDAEYQKDVA